MTTLNSFEGSEVVGTRIVVAKAGDGLSQALDMAPEELHTGDEVFLLLKGEITDVTFKPSKDAPECRIRVHRFLTESGMLVDGDVGERIMEAQEASLAQWREQQRLAEEEAAGVQRMFPSDTDDDETEFDEFDEETEDA